MTRGEVTQTRQFVPASCAGFDGSLRSNSIKEFQEERINPFREWRSNSRGGHEYLKRVSLRFHRIYEFDAWNGHLSPPDETLETLFTR